MRIRAYKAISGFIPEYHMATALNIYMNGAGVIQPIFARVDRHPTEFVAGYYASFLTNISDEDLDRLKRVMHDYIVGGE